MFIRTNAVARKFTMATGDTSIVRTSDAFNPGWSRQPASLTRLISKGNGPCGAIDMFDLMAAQRGSKACGWLALLGSCTKPRCDRCASGDVPNSADVATVKSLAVAGLLH